jgi:hypothetical protein
MKVKRKKTKFLNFNFRADPDFVVRLNEAIRKSRRTKTSLVVEGLEIVTERIEKAAA